MRTKRGTYRPKPVIFRRRQQVWHYTQAGLTQAEIAKAVGVSQQVVSKDIAWFADYLADQGAINPRRSRLVQLSAVRSKIRQMWSKADDNPQIMAILIRLWEREARLLGLDSPDRLELTADVTTTFPDPRKMSVEELREAYNLEKWQGE